MVEIHIGAAVTSVLRCHPLWRGATNFLDYVRGEKDGLQCK
jgi:hypothetical protein